MEARLSLVTLGVSDFARSVAFYERLGWEKRPESQGDVAFFGARGTWIGLFPRASLAADAHVAPEGTGFNAITLAHNVGSKAEVDAVLAEAVAAGATLVKPAQDVFWGGYNGYFADPDGFLWEIAWNPHFTVG